MPMDFDMIWGGMDTHNMNSTNRAFGLLLMLGVAVGLCGCSATRTAAPTSQAPAATSTADSNPLAPDAAADNASMPVPPEGAQYTLLCQPFTGPDHVLTSKRIKETLINATHSNNWYVVHSEQESDLYYGFYKTFQDRGQPEEYARAQNDHAKLTSMVDDNGERLFQQVMFVPINTPDPAAPKEWDLANNKGYWTLQIAVYRDSPQRKQAAVDSVRELRAHGYDAYYRHGPSTSEVYIGSWPREAVAEQEASSASSDDPDVPLLVLPNEPGLANRTFLTPDGRKMKAVMPKLDIVSPDLKKTTEEFPYYSLNGEIVGHPVKQSDGSEHVVPWSTYLLQVPHETEEAADGSAPVPTGDTAAPGNSDANAPVVPGLGGLR
jgi:hypothetical protein